MTKNIWAANCHPERSEGSDRRKEILRIAQDDKTCEGLSFVIRILTFDKRPMTKEIRW
jgi:hypothetical protein